MTWRSSLQRFVIRATESAYFLPAMIVLMVLVRIAVWTCVGYLGRKVGAEPAVIAMRLVDGYGFSCPYGPPRDAPTTCTAPLYIWVMAGVFYVCGNGSTLSFLVIQMLNLVFQAVTLVLLCRIVRSRLSPYASPILGILFALNPLLVFVAGNSQENALTTMLATIVAYDVLMCWRRGMPLIRFGLFGVLVGLVALSNAGFLPCLFVLCLLAVYWEIERAVSSRNLLRLAVLGVGFTIVVAPWSLRNYVVFDRFILIRGASYLQIYMANVPGSLGGHGEALQEYYLQSSPKERERLLELGEERYSEELGKAFHKQLEAEGPLPYIGRTVLRLFQFWLGDLDVTILKYNRHLYGEFIMCVVSMLVCTLESVLGLLGILLARKRGKGAWPLVVYLIVFPLPYYLIMIGFRYHTTITPFLLIFAAYWLSQRLLEGSQVNTQTTTQVQTHSSS